MSQIDRIATPSAQSALEPARSAWAHVGAGWPALVELTKPRITKMVMVTAAVGFALPATLRPWALADLLWAGAMCLLGAGLSASGASALNQWMERGRDGMMRRTCARPLPSGRVSPGAGLALGLALCALGVGVLWAFVNAAAAAVSLATIFAYLLLYTPLKPVTPLATIIGAVPGALPPLIGWTAALAPRGPGELPGPIFTDPSWVALAEPAGWSLFLIMLVWQVPHVLALSWMHREDYARAGYAVLPVVDPGGDRTVRATLLWTVALVPVSLIPVALLAGALGWLYTCAAVVLGVAFLLAAARFALTRTDGAARGAFIASIVYLPLLLGAMVVDACLRLALGAG